MTRSQSGVLGGVQVVDDPHLLAGIDARDVGQKLEAELRVVMQTAHDVGHVLGSDPDLGRVTALTDGIDQPLSEGGFEASLKPGIRSPDSRLVD